MLKCISISGGILVLLMTVSCARDRNYSYLVKALENCEKINEAYLDSQYAEFDCEKYEINYDYGYGVAAPNQSNSETGYIKSKIWLVNLFPTLLDSSEKTSEDSIFNKINIVSIDFEQKIAIIEFEGKKFEHKINIPEEYNNQVAIRYTTGSVITEIIYNDKKRDIFQCFKIDTTKYSNSTNSYKSLIVRVIPNDQNNVSVKEIMNIFDGINYPLKEE